MRSRIIIVCHILSDTHEILVSDNIMSLFRIGTNPNKTITYFGPETLQQTPHLDATKMIYINSALRLT